MLLAMQRVITAFLLPPGIFVLLLLLCAGFFWRRCRWLAVCNGVLAVVLWLSSVGPVADRMIAPLEASAPLSDLSSGKVDAIVLLGGGINDGVPDLSGSGAPSEEMLARIVTAVRVYRKLQVPIVVAGGAPPEFKTPEALIVRRFLLDLGIPEERIVIEDQSRDTLENARNVAVICQKLDYDRLLVVTSAYHVRRARLAFASAGLEVEMFPANFQSAPARHYGWATWLPSVAAQATVWRAGREYIGLLYYRLALGLR
jgi:uncharacterized SAM-binding protein YcdF (DUF218 family)